MCVCVCVYARACACVCVYTESMYIRETAERYNLLEEIERAGKGIL